MASGQDPAAATEISLDVDLFGRVELRASGTELYPGRLAPFARNPPAPWLPAGWEEAGRAFPKDEDGVTIRDDVCRASITQLAVHSWSGMLNRLQVGSSVARRRRATAPLARLASDLTGARVDIVLFMAWISSLVIGPAGSAPANRSR